MRKFIIIIAILISYHAKSQVVNILSFTRNSATVSFSGTKIQTNIPVGGSSDFQPVILIDGYSYFDASIISIKLAWHTRDNEFENASATSGGGFAPNIFLKNEAGKAVIYIAPIAGGDGIFRLTVSGLYETNSQDEQDWYQGWSASEVSIEPDNSIGLNSESSVIYHNEFNGDTKVQGLLTATSAAVTDAYIGNMTVAKVKGVLPVEDPVNEGAVTLVPGDGGINIISGNDNHSYIDFRGVAHLSRVQGRILHSDNLGFRIFTNGVTKTLSNNTVVPNPPAMVINNNGVVGIGNTTDLASTSTTPYKLFVEGGIRTRKLKVDAVATAWPDYVFEPTYGLRSLASLEAFIKANKHLPDMPSADDVNKDGVDVGDVQAALLKKVEELTLYVITLNKTVTTQQATIEKQQQVLNTLQTNKQ